MRYIIFLIIIAVVTVAYFKMQSPNADWGNLSSSIINVVKKDMTKFLKQSSAPSGGQDATYTGAATSGVSPTAQAMKNKWLGLFTKASVSEPTLQAKSNAVTLVLTNGEQLRGTLVNEDEHEYLVRLQGGTVGFSRNEVAQIIRDGEVAPQTELVTLHLTNGGAITGELIREDDEQYVVRWQGSITTFKVSEVARVSRGEALATADGIVVPEVKSSKGWQYTHDMAVKMRNGEVFDGAIDRVTENLVVLRTTFKDGGFIEQEIARHQVDEILFKAINNEDSRTIEESLRELFPKMQFYQEGNITIVTDSYTTWVQKYKKALRTAQTEIFLQFYPLFKTKKQRVQHFVVIFDHPADYIEYAISDGVPGWIVPGYYRPGARVLYLYNMVGDPMEEFIHGLMKHYYGKSIDIAVEQIEARVDKRYHVFIEGQAKGFKDKYWEYFDWWMSILRKTTFAVLRHEFAHEIFSNWDLVLVVVPKMDEASVPDLEKKKEFLKTEDKEEKMKVLLELATLRSEDVKPDIQAANSWLAEGLATYCETSPMGRENDDRLFGYQEMMRNNAFFPLGQLTVYKLGSFPGMYHEAMLFAYSQSWALVSFLMDTYPEQFMQYIQKISQQTPVGEQDLQWLLEAIGKDRRAIEAELMAYMQQFPEIDNPLLVLMERRKKLRDSLMHFGHVRS